jgi:hypothetical protein
MGTISTDSYVCDFIFHEEDYVSDKLPIETEGKYLVFVETTKPLQLMTNDELFVGVETYCKEVRQGFSSYAERTAFGLPRLLIADRSKPLSDMMDQLFYAMGEGSNAQELLNFIPDEPDKEGSENAIETNKIMGLLGYSVQIQFKLPFKVKCSFTCGKSFKKEVLLN